MIARTIILWFAILLLAVLNGIAREKLLRPRLSRPLANTLSGLSLIAWIGGLSFAAIGWLPRATTHGYLIVGVSWLALTVAFEFTFGRLVARTPWRELLGAYRFRDGNIWPLVLAAVTLAPWAAATTRGLAVTD